MHLYFYFFFLNDPATTEIYTLSLHDALPISGLLRQHVGLQRPEPRPHHRGRGRRQGPHLRDQPPARAHHRALARPAPADRKSTRLNSSHLVISYAVFCLKKKTHLITRHTRL